MNSRERVLKAFKLLEGEPDRVPVQFDLCRNLADHMGKELNIPVHYTDNLYEDVTYRISANELRIAMGSDVVITGASVSDDYKIEKEPDGTWLNEYKMRMRQGDIYVEVVDYPLSHAETRADIESYNFPDPDAPGRYRDAERLVKKYHDDYLVFGDIEVTVFSLAHQLVGMEKLLVDMMMETDYVIPLFEACAEFQTEVGLRLIEKGVDAIWFGDDFGTQSSLIMPPEIFRSQLKPIYKRMIDRFKEAKPDIIPILHCDGAVSELLDDIHDMGFRVFNPVQPGVPGHLPKDLKERFGDKFSFWGAIDQQYLLPNGTDEELEKDIIDKISVLGKDGGYMIAPAHIIQNDVSPDRVKLFIKLCMKNASYLILVVSLLANCFFASAQQSEYKYPFQNPSLSTAERVSDLVSRMTLQEKADQLLYTAPAIPRLGVPEYNWWNEALHGVARSGFATVFPQSITIANSWDEGLMFNVANAISDEARAKYNEFQRRGKRGIYQGLTFWSPNINIFRDPRWGRGHETYGEDPYLTGRLGYEFVKGMQGDDPKYLKTVATAKHYAVHSGPEPLRHSFNAKISESDLRETYLPAFRTLVMDAGVYSVMGAYNRFRDYPCCANPILYGILRNEWGFKGYIVSDCWAVSDFYKFTNFAKDPAEAAAQAVRAGTDLECGVDYKNLVEAVNRGLLTEAEIDIAVKRVFTARFKLGMFDPDEIVPYAQIPFFVNCSDYNNSLSREAAQKSIVLLKNENNILPLSKEIRTIAVIGPNADNFEALIGNYNGIPKDPVTVLKGIENKLCPAAKIIYAEGSDLAEGIHNLTPIPSRYLQTQDGLQGAFGEYFDNREMTGKPVFTRVDDNINFYWEHLSPRYDMPDDNFGIKWTTYLVPPETGTYYIGGWGSSAYDILLDGKELISSRSDHSAFHIESPAELQAGRKYKIEVLYKNYAGDADIKLLWAQPRLNLTEQAVKAAKEADVVVLVLGLSQRLEGEEMPIKIDGFSGGDRTNLNLPANQELLLDAVCATGKPVVVVLTNGGAMSVNKAQEKAAAILLAGYGGQQGGNGVADVLFGDYNPAGRLPVTYYKSIDQIPAFENYDMAGKTYRYFASEPLYPFGFGLSYTNFAYSNLSIPENAVAGEKVIVKVTVTNSGKLSGEEVVQLYITDEKASTPRPIRQLEGFRRISLKSGESKVVEFTIDPRQFSIINKKNKRVIEPGYFTVSIGGKQPGFKGYLDPVFTQVLTGRVRLTGVVVPFSN